MHHSRPPRGAPRTLEERPLLRSSPPLNTPHRPLCPAFLGAKGDPKRQCPSALQEGVGRERCGSLPPRLQVVQHQGGLGLRVPQEAADALLDLHRAGLPLRASGHGLAWMTWEAWSAPRLGPAPRTPLEPDAGEASPSQGVREGCQASWRNGGKEGLSLAPGLTPSLPSTLTVGSRGRGRVRVRGSGPRGGGAREREVGEWGVRSFSPFLLWRDSWQEARGAPEHWAWAWLGVA